MKAFKIVTFSLLTISVILYLTFIFLLPQFIDLNKYSENISQEIQKSTGFKVELKDLKIKTAWNLSAGAIISKTDLKYPNNTKFAQINNLQIRLSLIPLIRHQFQLDKIIIDKIMVNLDLDKSGNFKIKQYINQNSNGKLPFNLIYSKKQPNIHIKKYRIALIQEQNNNTYVIKGTNLHISDYTLNKKIKLKTNGNLILNNKKQISYNVDLESKIFPKKESKINHPITVLNELIKYNIIADIEAKLNLQKENIEGKLNIDKISFIYEKVQYPQSSLKLAFKGDRANLNASLHTTKNLKANITGYFNTGKKRYIDLHVLSDRMNIKDVLLIAKAMSKPFGITKIKNFDANGTLKANFDIKSNFKQIESNGYLRIFNAKLTDKINKISLDALNADIDFSRDSVILKQANAKINNQPISISGSINENAIANILVTAKNLPLKGLLITTGHSNLLKRNQIKSGIVNLNASIIGQLDKAIPKINITIDNICINNIHSKSNINIRKAIAKCNYNKNIQGNIQAVGIKTLLNSSEADISSINLVLNNNELIIPKTLISYNNIKMDLYGKISQLYKNPVFDTINISIPNQISVPVKGYPNSKATLSGNITLSESTLNPNIKGNVYIPLVRIPSLSTIIKNASIEIDKEIFFNCQQIQVANSLIKLNAQIDRNISKNIIVKNINFISDNIDLNYLIPLSKNLQKNSDSNIIIQNGKSSIQNFRVGKIISNNITSDISLNNNNLHLNNVRGSAYFGKIAGDINYDLKHKKTSINIQGRNLSASPALIALTGRDDDIHGQLDFDSNISIGGYSKSEILHSLKGFTNFIITNGKMGVLGKFEHLLYAQNVISVNLLRANLNAAIKALTAKNTGVYKYMKGKITFSNGWANIVWVKTSGPTMSLYMTGRYYMPDNTANLIILGRISDDVVRILGPIGEFSMNKVLSYMPKLGEINTFFTNQITTNPNYENTSEIPYLTPQTEFRTKEYKVVIDGDIQRQSSVKSFKWLSSPKIIQTEQPISQKKIEQTKDVPEFVKKLPDFN